MPVAVWTSDRRIYLTRDGQVVEHSDPRKATLLVPAGGSLPLARAVALGLSPEPEPKAKPTTPANKARPAPTNKAKD